MITMLHFHSTLANHYADRLRKAPIEQRFFLRDSFRYHHSQAKTLTDAMRHSLPAVCVGQSSPQGLTKKEEKLFEALSQAEPRNITLLGIQAKLAEGSTDTFRATMRELRAQAVDAPNGLQKTLGDALFQLLVNTADGSEEDE